MIPTFFARNRYKLPDLLADVAWLYFCWLTRDEVMYIMDAGCKIRIVPTTTVFVRCIGFEILPLYLDSL